MKWLVLVFALLSCAAQPHERVPAEQRKYETVGGLIGEVLGFGQTGRVVADGVYQLALMTGIAGVVKGSHNRRLKALEKKGPTS